jgi:hypothetical protein
MSSWSEAAVVSEAALPRLNIGASGIPCGGRRLTYGHRSCRWRRHSCAAAPLVARPLGAAAADSEEGRSAARR